MRQNLEKPGTRWTNVKWKTGAFDWLQSSWKNSIRGRTWHAVPSSHSGSPLLATNGAKTKAKKSQKQEKKYLSTNSRKQNYFLCRRQRQREAPVLMLISAEEPSASSLLTIWARSLSWADFMSFLIAHIWKRASRAAQSVSQWGYRRETWQTRLWGEHKAVSSSQPKNDQSDRLSGREWILSTTKR